jgi:peptide deformylase
MMIGKGLGLQFVRPLYRQTAVRGARTKGAQATLAALFARGAGFGRSAEKDPGVVPGTDLRVLMYPHPKLRAESKEITVFGSNSEVRDIAREMLLVMYAAEGIGLSAPQVGVNKRLMVFNENGDRKEKDLERVFVNPQIIRFSPETESDEEGCLSFPSIYGHVTRSLSIDIKYDDLDGSSCMETLEGLPARIFQHEYDHLDGVLFIDRFDDKDKGKMHNRLNRLDKKFGPGGLK